MAMTEPGRLEADLSHDLREAVLIAIRDRGLSPEDLARDLDLVPASVRALLVHEHWPLHTAVLMADGMNIHVRFDWVPATEQLEAR
jgi:hypothetical protein